MVAKNMEVKIEMQYRPCIVNNKKCALFHKWEHCSEIIPPSPLAGGHGGGVLEYDVAIVEYEDGTIGEVLPKYIRFLDNIFHEYCFGQEEENTQHENQETVS